MYRHKRHRNRAATIITRMEKVSVAIVLFLALLALPNDNGRQLVDCFSLPITGTAKLKRFSPAATPSTPSSLCSVGNPALLDAISKFSPSSDNANVITADACRVFHGRGGLFPGADHLALDYFPPVFLLTSFQHVEEEDLDVYGNALSRLWRNQILPTATIEGEEETAENPAMEIPAFTWVYQCRAQRGNTTTQLMCGQIPNPHVVTENNGKIKYLVHLAKGQNNGLFLDMSSGRAWLHDKCTKGEISSVLNLFAYTCAFSVAALNGGASNVVNVDMSRGALKIGQRNHDLNELKKQGKSAKFLSHDLFKSWGKLKRNGPYDCVVADPPSYQKGSFVASKDYVKVIQRLPSLLNEGGWALLCLNAPELDSNFILERVREGAPEMQFVERLDNPLSFVSGYPERELKVLVFRYRPSVVVAEC